MNEKLYSLIERYFDQGLSSSEQEELQAAMQEDSELLTAFELRQEMEHFLETDQKRQQAHQLFEELGEQHFVPEKGSSKVFRLRPVISILALAAAIALILIIWQPWQSGDLYQQYAQHQSINLVERNNEQEVLDRLQNAFNNQEYELAYQEVNKLKSLDTDAQLQLIKGIAALETDRNEDAEKVLEQLAAGGSAYSEDAIWYRGLLAIRLKNWQAARLWLNSLPGDSFWFAKAQALLEELPE